MESLLQIADSVENNVVHRAVQENCLEAVKFFVKKGVNTTNTIKEGQTPLYIAVKNNYQDIMIELCKNKSRKELRNLINRRTACTGSTALHAEVQNNSLEMTKFLLSRGAIFDTRAKPNQRPEQLTTDKGIRELFEIIEDLFNWVLLTDDEYNIPQDPQEFCPVDNLAAVTYARDSQNRTALQLAMEKNQLNEAATIIECRIEKLKQDDWQLGMDFYKLAHYSEAARLHLSNLDAFHYEDNDLAVRKEVLDLLCQAHEFLEAFKAQVDPSLDNQPLLITIEESIEFFGAWKGSKFVANQKLDSMLKNRVSFIILALKLCIIAPMQLFMRQVYTSELLEAAKRNDLTMVERCLTGHPNVNKTDADDRTALRFAFENKNHEMAKMLLTRGADPASGKTRKNDPLLYFALRHMQESPSPIDPQVMQLLFERLSDNEKSINFVNAKTTNGVTALHWASRHDDHRLVQFLLNKGAIYCAKDLCGRTPGNHRGSHDSIRRLFDEIHRLFAYASYGQIKELIEAMEKLDNVFDLLAAGGARNDEGQTLVEVLEVKGRVDEAGLVRKLMSSDEADRCKKSATEFLCQGSNKNHVVFRNGISFR